MSLATDLKTLYHLTLRRPHGVTHAARLEDFYAPQARIYDGFRERMLPGRRELFEKLPTPPDGVWVDLGGGTGRSIEHLGARRAQLARLYIVDLSPSMLRQARERGERLGWHNVETVCANATHFKPAAGPADVVTFSYALTMIPDWQAALENAISILKPDGLLGVVDFYVSESNPAPPRVRHSRFTRAFWPAWFRRGNVHISSDHVPCLHARFAPVSFHEFRARLPYAAIVRIPCYSFIGRRRLPR